MYIEHPYQYGGKYYAKVDGEFIEITKEVAYAMNNFYRSSMPKTLAIKNEKGEVIGKILREIPYSAAAGEDDKFMIEDFPDRHCNVEETVMNQVEGQEMKEAIHEAISGLDEEERTLIYAIYFEGKTQLEMADIMGISRQVLAYKLKKILIKMQTMLGKNIF